MLPFAWALMLLTLAVDATSWTPHGVGHVWKNVDTGETGTVTSVADGDAALRKMIANKKVVENKIHVMVDQRRFHHDEAQLAVNEAEWLDIENPLIAAARDVYAQTNLTIRARNAQLRSDINALNATVQSTEAFSRVEAGIKYGVEVKSEEFDAHKQRLLREVGAADKDATRDRTLTSDEKADAMRVKDSGLTVQRQTAVHNKKAENANFLAIDVIAKARRAEKEQQWKHTISERGDLNDEKVRNSGLENQTVALAAQRDQQEKEKLAITVDKKNMKVQQDGYKARSISENTKRADLEQTYRQLIIENARLKEMNTGLQEERVRLKIDRDNQRTDFIRKLLEKNAATEYSAAMKAGYDAEVASRKSVQDSLRVVEEKNLADEFARRKCDNNAAIYTREIEELKIKNNDLNSHCY